MAMRLIDRRACSAAAPSCAPRAMPCVQPRGRGIARATAGPKLTPQDLQARLQLKEQQLARMFESGRPMPKASEVASIRSEIDNIRAALEGRAQYVPPPPSQPGGPGGPSRGGPPSRSSAPPGPTPAPPPYIGDNNLAAGVFSSTPAPPPPGAAMPPPPAEDPFAGLEAAMRANQGMGAIDDAEIARLEAENTILRAQAHKLLTRQAQLEQLLAEAQGEKEPELLLETTQGLLERMKTKLKKADLTGAAKFAPGAPGFDAPPSTGPSMGSGRPQMPPSPPSRRP